MEGNTMSEKETLPLLPLRGLVVYPHMMVNLDVGRGRSVAAIERAIAGDNRILLVAQRDPELDDPTVDDLYDVGTVAEIRQFLRMPEGVLRILVDGQKRAQICAVREGEDCTEADVCVAGGPSCVIVASMLSPTSPSVIDDSLRVMAKFRL